MSRLCCVGKNLLQEFYKTATVSLGVQTLDFLGHGLSALPRILEKKLLTLARERYIIDFELQRGAASPQTRSRAGCSFVSPNGLPDRFAWIR